MKKAEQIKKIKSELGSKLTILAHHYQTDDIVELADYVGDSLELSKLIPKLEAEYIVFCGVYFMAESAAVLAKPNQKVFIPNTSATCVMSEAAPGPLVHKILKRLSEGGKIVPLTYVNSSAAVKAAVGEFAGSICTSSNAPTMLRWALEQDGKVVFLPDNCLGRNTADLLGLPEDTRVMLDIRKNGENVDPGLVQKYDLIFWPASCPVHSVFFTAGSIRKARANHPDQDVKVVLHPESSPEAVQLADSVGSTSRIIEYVRTAPPGSIIYVGTETTLVNRLAKEYAGEKTILPLAESYCSNMAKITLDNLLYLLENISTADPVIVPAAESQFAKEALERMLQVSATSQAKDFKAKKAVV